VQPKDTVEDVSTHSGGIDEPLPMVVLIASGVQPLMRSMGLADGRLTLGRRVQGQSGISFELPDDRVSREHAEVRFAWGRWTVKDLESRNGTFVDGRRVRGQVSVDGTPVLRLGHSVFLLLADGRGYVDDAVDDQLGLIAGPRLKRVFEEIQRAGQTAPSLLINGESGTGKELAAKMFHDAGPRSGGPFVAVNCAAIPEGVAERLLFGARKGAFSGAADAPGYVQAADGGTLFLDELGELDLAVQAKLLRVLETREVMAVGAVGGSRVDIGIVAATHRDLRSLVSERKFREDLYFRMSKPAIHIPPLRQRRVEIPLMVARALADVASSKQRLVAHAKLIETCCLRPWPGNVRELMRELHNAADAARAAGVDTVRAEHLSPTAGMPFGQQSSIEATDDGQVAPASAPAPAPAPKTPLPDVDREMVMGALGRCKGNVSAAARDLGLHRTQFYRLMKKFGVKEGSGGE
jgi:transcriptional regulator with PAS, ATPase and Fis domain